MRRRLFLLSLFALAGCAAPGAPPLAAAEAAFAELEPLYGAEARRDGLAIRLASNGCTIKADIAVHVDKDAAGRTRVAFARKRLDPCRSFAMGRAEVTFGWDELGVPARTPVVLLNPLVAWTGPGA